MSFILSLLTGELRKYLIIGVILPLIMTVGYWIVKSYFRQQVALESAQAYQVKVQSLSALNKRILSDYNFDMSLISSRKEKCPKGAENWCKQRLPKGWHDGFKNINVDQFK